MDRIELLAAINLFALQLEQEPDDLHEVHFKVKEMLNQLQAMGMPLPDDLVQFDRELTKRVEGAG